MKKNPKILPGDHNKKKNSKLSLNFSPSIIIKAVFVIIVVFGLIYLFFFSSFFKISDIEIDGAKLAESSEIENLVLKYTAEDDNIWTFSRYNLEKEIENNFLFVESVVVQKGIPDTLRVKVKEREPAVIWLSGKDKYLIDSFGYAFSNLADYQDKRDLLTDKMVKVTDRSKLPVTIGQRLASKNWVNFVGKIDRSLMDQFSLSVKNFYITETAFDLYAITNKGRLIFDTNRPIEEQLAALEVAFDSINKERFDYLDLRINGWVYYK